MKLVVLDGYTENPGDLSWGALRRFGELTVYERTSDDQSEVAERIKRRGHRRRQQDAHPGGK